MFLGSMNSFKHLSLTSILLLQGCNAPQQELAKPAEETIPIIDQVSTVLKEDKATVIALFVKPQRTTSCEKMYVEISIFNEQLNKWESAIEFDVKRNSKEAIGGPDMDEQLFMASLNRLENFAISGMGCQPYQGKMSKNYQIYATFKPEYGKINIIGTIEQNILAKGVNIYDFKDSATLAKDIIKTEKPSLEAYVVPAKLDVKLWSKFEGKSLTPSEIMADKHGAKTFILYQLEIQSRIDRAKVISENFINAAADGTATIKSVLKARKLSLRMLDNQREDVYKFYDMLAEGTLIRDAAIYTELLTNRRRLSLKYELGEIGGSQQSIGLIDYDNLIKKHEKSGSLKGLKTKSRITEFKERQHLREKVNKAEEPYLKVMYPFSKLRSVKSRDEQVELTRVYLDALDELELFDARRHVKRTGLAQSNAEIYIFFHENMMEARRNYLMDFAERAHEKDYLMSKNYHTFKRIYTQTQEDIDLLETELFSAL